jgi:HEAT repeat protein
MLAADVNNSMLVSPLLGCFEKQSEDWIVRLSAAASLGLVRAREALLLFIEELNSHEVNSESGKSLLVQTVICALGDLAYADYSQSEMDQELLQRSVRAIERFTRSEDVLVRISVTESLGHWCRHSSKARAAVESLLLDPNENVAKTARFALDTYAKQDQ